ncbi:MAG: hypothetical protein ACUVXI_05260 [bacterium]
MGGKPKLIITNVGTSILEHRCFTDKTANIENYDVKDIYEKMLKGDVKVISEGRAENQRKVEDFIFDRLKRLDLENERDLENSSAEIKSLVKIGIGEDDKIVLCTTDTPTGALSGRLVKTFIEENFSCDVELKVIDGMQVDDPNRFRREGIQNYIEFMVNLVKEESPFKYSHDIILNPTGGYKAIVPYLTAIGMLYNVQMQYIFETSQELITLLPIPIMLDRDMFAKFESKLDEISSDYVKWNKFWEGIDPAYKDRLMPCIESEEDLVTLSPLGRIFYEKFKEPEVPPPPETNMDPEDKIHTSKEPHHGRSEKFEIFQRRLAENPHITSIHYFSGTSDTRRNVALVGREFRVAFEGIVLSVETTATHPKHFEQIRGEIQNIIDEVK